jgi:hypothetical protein
MRTTGPHTSTSCRLGTRIAFPLEMIRAQFPKLSSRIPLSQYLSVGVTTI